MSTGEDQPRYHEDTLDEMAHLILSELGRRIDDFADGDVSGLSASLTSLMRVLKEMAPEQYPAIMAAMAPQSPARSVVAAIGLSTSDEWVRHGINDPLDVKAWQVLGLMPEEARRYVAAGITPFEAFEWNMEEPANIDVYRGAGWTATNMVPVLAREVGASAQEAIQALLAISDNDVTSVSLRAALLWIGSFPDEVTAETYPMVRGLAEHMSPEEASRWEIPLATITQWLARGHTRSTFEAIKELGGNPLQPIPYVPSTGRWRLSTHLSAATVDDHAVTAGWERSDATRTEPATPHVTWVAYSKNEFVLQVRFVHDAADFAEQYVDGQLVGFVSSQPDLMSRIADTLAYPHTLPSSTLGLREALVELQAAGWVPQTHPKGKLRHWYETAPPAYYGLTSAQVHAMLGRYQFGGSALDVDWVDIVMSRDTSTFNMAAIVTGEILVVATPVHDEGLWGSRAEKAIQKFCR
jgi:hypothetical protein